MTRGTTEVSDASADEVERVARALCRHDANKGGIWFDDEALNKHIFNNWRKFRPEARAALSAMNRGGLREALEYIIRQDGKGPDGFINWQHCVNRIQAVARAALQHPAKEMGE